MTTLSRSLALLCCALAALALLVSGPARARDPRTPAPLTYHWPIGETLHYRLQLYLATPLGTRLIATQDKDARMTEMTIALLVDCVAKEPMERYQSMECGVHRVEMGGTTGTYNEDAKLLKILKEYQDSLSASVVQVEWSLTGRIRTLDVEGPLKKTDNQATVHEWIRLLTAAAFSGLELELPKKGLPVVGDSWKQGGSPVAMRLPNTQGTAGGVRVIHQVIGEEEGMLHLQTVGEGTLVRGDTTEGQQLQVSASLSGDARFDPTRKLLVYNRQVFQGVLTAQSQGGALGSGHYITQITLTDLLPSFEELDRERNAALQEAPSNTGEVLQFDPNLQQRDPNALNDSLREGVGLPTTEPAPSP